MLKENLLKILKLNNIKPNKNKPTKKKIKKNLNKKLKNFIPKINYDGRTNGVLLFT
jgi:hypothetical protein